MGCYAVCGQEVIRPDCPMEKKGKTVSRKYMGVSYSSSQEVMLFLHVSSMIVSGDCVIHRIETHYHSQCFPASWRKHRPSMDELWLQNAIWYRLCHIDHIIYINLEILNRLWPLSPIFTLHLLLSFSFGFGFWVKTGVNVWENQNEERLPVWLHSLVSDFPATVHVIYDKLYSFK